MKHTATRTHTLSHTHTHTHKERDGGWGGGGGETDRQTEDFQCLTIERPEQRELLSHEAAAVSICLSTTSHPAAPLIIGDWYSLTSGLRSAVSDSQAR